MESNAQNNIVEQVDTMYVLPVKEFDGLLHARCSLSIQIYFVLLPCDIFSILKSMNPANESQ